MASNTREWDGSFDAVEALVRAAGRYVEASDDLRPRVIESAKSRCDELCARRWIRGLGFVVVFLSVATASFEGRYRSIGARSELALAAMNSRRLYSQAEAKAQRGGEIGWGIVDAFSEWRDRQSAALRGRLSPL